MAGHGEAHTRLQQREACPIFAHAHWYSMQDMQYVPKVLHFSAFHFDQYCTYVNKPCGARRKSSGALDSCFGLVSPHQQSIPYPYLQAPRVYACVHGHIFCSPML